MLHCIASIDNLDLSQTSLLSSYILSISSFAELPVTVDTMRLLDTTTLKLHELVESRELSYAILSHTWGAEEVTFQEMTDLFDEDGCQCGKANKRAKTLAKAGYQKIFACCRQAKRDGLRYAWIDTCCIDKSSSAELSEAINSMWRWYMRSSLCYVYLEDVAPRSAQSPDHFERSLAKSRWVTRAWCLQELLAPSNVVFLARDWSAVGLKCTLSKLLCFSDLDPRRRHWELPRFTTQVSNVTGIPEDALSDELCGRHYSIAQKMSWAANRDATRIEDRAYSLIGLFDINMPLLYGENSRAFYRFQEELIRHTADHSIFAFQCRKVFTDALAWSPEMFHGCGNISSTERRLNPYRMTNVGVEIDLDVANWHDDRFQVALLECFDRRGGGLHGNQLAMLLTQPAAPDDSRLGTAVCRAEVEDRQPFITLDKASKEKLGPFVRTKLLIARDGDEYWAQTIPWSLAGGVHEDLI